MKIIKSLPKSKDEDDIEKVKRVNRKFNLRS